MVLDGTNLTGFQLLIPLDFILLPLTFIINRRGISEASLISVFFFEDRLVLIVLLEHHGLVLSACGSSLVFVDDVSVATHSSIVFVCNKFSVKLVVKEIKDIEIFIVTVVNYSLFVFVVDVDDNCLFTQDTQFDALLQQAFSPLHVSAVSTVIVGDLFHYFILSFAHSILL
mgnify:FL=1